jgi:hypothetical protein
MFLLNIYLLNEKILISSSEFSFQRFDTRFTRFTR